MFSHANNTRDLAGYTLGSMDTSFRLSYPCHTGRFHVIIFKKLLMSLCLCFLGYTIFLLNGFIFKLFERSTLEIKSFFMHALFEWSVIFSQFSFSSLLVLLDLCNFGS